MELVWPGPIWNVLEWVRFGLELRVVCLDTSGTAEASLHGSEEFCSCLGLRKTGQYKIIDEILSMPSYSCKLSIFEK